MEKEGISIDNGWPEYAVFVIGEIKRLNKWMGANDEKLDNHITHIEHRLTKIETGLKNMRWLVGSVFLSLLTVIGLLVVQLVV